MISRQLRESRVAVSALFFINGFLYANWTARLPELQRLFGLDNAQLGTVLFCIALGSMVAMPASGWLAARYGSDVVVRAMSVAFCLSIPLVPVFRDEWAIRACFFLLGAASGCMDVTMNGQAVLVEKKWAKTIISSFHAIFSVGMALGAGSGSLFAKFGVGLGPHLLAISAAGLAAVALAALRLVPDPPEAHVRPDESRTPLRAAIWTILPFGIIAFCCMTSEGAMVDWSAIFMSKVIGQNEALLDSLLALGGLALALGVGAVWSTFVGFFLVGLGLASIVPIVYSLAGSVRGVSATTGISVVTSIGYTGFFVGPPAIGFLAETFGLRLGLTYVGGLLLVMLALIGRQMQQKGAGGLS